MKLLSWTSVVRFGLVVAISAAGAAAAEETFTGTAEVTNVDGEKLTAPVTVRIDRFLTTAERDSVLKALKEGTSTAARKALEALPDIGSVEGRLKKVPIKFAFPRPTGSGRLITVVTAQSLVHLGSDKPGAKATGGYDFGFILLVLDANGRGQGEIAPAAKIRLREDGALATEDYGGETVWLKGIVKK
jgi:hypothetical protein